MRRERQKIEQYAVLGFDSRAGQIGHNVTNGQPPLRRFFGAALPRCLAVEMSPKPLTLATRFGVILRAS